MSGRREDLGDWPYRDRSALRPPDEPVREDGGEELRRLPTREELGYPPEPDPDPLPEPARLPTSEELGLSPLEEPDRESEAEAESAALVAPPEAEPEPQAAREPQPGPEAPLEPEQPVVAEHATGELRVPDGYAVIAGGPGGGGRTVGIVVSRFNGEITNRLLESAFEELEEAGVARESVVVMPVPGAFELPLAAIALARTRRYSCIVALGCVIRGETPHFDYVAGEAASGLQLAAIETGVPVAFGLLTCESREQAEARVGKGAEAVRTALEMADLFARLRAEAAASS